MDTFTLYRDVADLMTIVAEDGRGWPGAYWSSSLFVADAWAIRRRSKTELNRPTPEWARRLEWPEPVARWSQSTGELIVLDNFPGQRAERYLGIVYDAARWETLPPDAFAAAIRAAVSCPLTTETAVLALSKADRLQLSRFAARDLLSLQRHPDIRVREATRDIRPQHGPRVAAK